jgi:Mn-containing catalase
MAEKIQLEMKGKEIGITEKLYEAISDEVIRDSFAFDEEREIYIGKGTWAAIEQAEQAKAYTTGAIPSYSKAGSIVFGIKAQAEESRPLKVTRPWGV